MLRPDAADCIDTFEVTCREADRRAAARPRDRNLAKLQQLLDSSISLERAYAELNQRDHATASTIEALMFTLRRGVDELAKPYTQRRLSELSEDRLRTVCGRLQNFKSEIALAWAPEEVEVLMNVWSAVHGP